MSTSLHAWICIDVTPVPAIAQLVQKCSLGVDIMDEKNALLAADRAFL